jgi:hypothetical protein
VCVGGGGGGTKNCEQHPMYLLSFSEPPFVHESTFMTRYNITADPFETTDRSSDSPEVVKSLLLRMAQYASSPDQVPPTLFWPFNESSPGVSPWNYQVSHEFSMLALSMLVIASLITPCAHVSRLEHVHPSTRCALACPCRVCVARVCACVRVCVRARTPNISVLTCAVFHRRVMFGVHLPHSARNAHTAVRFCCPKAQRSTRGATMSCAEWARLLHQVLHRHHLHLPRRQPQSALTRRGQCSTVAWEAAATQILQSNPRLLGVIAASCASSTSGARGGRSLWQRSLLKPASSRLVTCTPILLISTRGSKTV